MEQRMEILQGTLDLMVLQAVAAMGPQHGYAIAARLEQVANGSIQLNMGTLYPALVRLEQRGYLRGEWKVTEKKRRAKYYEITHAGRKHMQAERANWVQMTEIMGRLMEGES